MNSMLTAGAATLALLLAGCGDGGGEANQNATASATTKAAIPAPNGGDWAETVTATADGGFQMGNPNAPVKLVEYASLTCPHCADFSEKAVPQLVEKYIRTGRVSYEMRNFVRDPVDLTASLITRCGGATPYFKLTEQMFAAQEDWFGKIQAIPAAEQQRLQTLQEQRRTKEVMTALAEQAGLVQFARVRGLPTEKVQACLGDDAAVRKLVEMNQTATRDYDLRGTPTFIINGSVVPNAASWELLEPKLREAIG